MKRHLESAVDREDLDDSSSVEDGFGGDLEGQLGHGENSDHKAEKNRERNREHAKRTRQRKKEMIEGMKIRLLELQREASRLEQLLEESNTANILLCLSGKPEDMSAHEDGFGAPESLQPGPNDPNTKIPVSRGNIIDQLRQRVRVEAAQTLRDKSEASRSRSSSNAQDQDVIPTHSGSQDGADELSVQDEAFITSEDEQIKKNLQTYAAAWKAGQEIDPNVLVESIAPIEKLTGIQNGGNLSAGDLKRERNRMHAKLTRDRKKLFTSRLQQTIQTLERHNQLIRNKLYAAIHSGQSLGSMGNFGNSQESEITDPLTLHPDGGMVPAARLGLSSGFREFSTGIIPVISSLPPNAAALPVGVPPSLPPHSWHTPTSNLGWVPTSVAAAAMHNNYYAMQAATVQRQNSSKSISMSHQLQHPQSLNTGKEVSMLISGSKPELPGLGAPPLHLTTSNAVNGLINSTTSNKAARLAQSLYEYQSSVQSSGNLPSPPFPHHNQSLKTHANSPGTAADFKNNNILNHNNGSNTNNSIVER